MIHRTHLHIVYTYFCNVQVRAEFFRCFIILYDYLCGVVKDRNTGRPRDSPPNDDDDAMILPIYV